MVRVELPTAVLAVVVIVRVELAPVATEEGLNVAVAPAGSPLVLRLTEPLKPFERRHSPYRRRCRLDSRFANSVWLTV